MPHRITFFLALVLLSASSCSRAPNSFAELFGKDFYTAVEAEEIAFSDDCLVLVNPRLPFFGDPGLTKMASLADFRGKTLLGIRGRKQLLATESALVKRIPTQYGSDDTEGDQVDFTGRPHSLELQAADFQLIQIQADGEIKSIPTKDIKFYEVDRRSHSSQSL